MSMYISFIEEGKLIFRITNCDNQHDGMMGGKKGKRNSRGESEERRKKITFDLITE